MSSRRVLAVLLLTATLGCSEPPDKEHHQAEGALAAARAADAAVYAPEELHAAETALAQDHAAVAQRDYRQALRLALETRDSAYEAVKRAGDQKAAARGEAELAIAELDRLTKLGMSRLAGTTLPRISGAAAERVRTTLRGSATLLQEARTEVAAQKYRDAITKLASPIAALRQELEPSADSNGRRGR